MGRVGLRRTTGSADLSARDFAAVIVGGGVAGAATALALARKGLPTLVVERNGDQGDRFGESLAPSVNPLIERLGLREAFLATDPLPCYGNRSAWGSDRLDHRDFIRDPYGHGWHVDRPRFDAMLIDAARLAGAHVALRSTVVAASRLENGSWPLTLEGPDGPRSVTARVVVDASGRASFFARGQGARRLFEDHLVAAVAILEPEGPPILDSTTLIEACRDGWWYSALLPDGCLATAYLTDPDLLAATQCGTSAGWEAALAETTYTRLRIAKHAYGLAQPPRVVAAGSAFLDGAAGPGWLAVGDAAASFDPLSSHGIASALSTGLRAAASVRAYVDGARDAFQPFAVGVTRSFARYQFMRQAYYAEERRWSDAPFWRRRQRLRSAVSSR
ncbi:MAG: hypothetical protein HW416_532 [Chloroflexi bacterium]|nr:hypothetical protein [Chloroflexota bacterium]